MELARLFVMNVRGRGMLPQIPIRPVRNVEERKGLPAQSAANLW